MGAQWTILGVSGGVLGEPSAESFWHVAVFLAAIGYLGSISSLQKLIFCVIFGLILSVRGRLYIELVSRGGRSLAA